MRALFASLVACAPVLVFACAEDAGRDTGTTQVPVDAATEKDTGERPPFDAAIEEGDADATTADAGAVDIGPAGDFRKYADESAKALQKLYDTGNGLFPSTGWWNSANALTAIIDHARATGATDYVGDIATTFDKNKGGQFLNDFYDDEGWWALAWIDAYDLTKETRYLDAAKAIFSDMKGGWDDTCGGGIWWSKKRTYKNAIANELFLEIAIRLHQRTPGDSGSGSFLDWAKREWAWFAASGMINEQNLVNDGLEITEVDHVKTCKNNGQTTWTYNQGVLVGGLVELSLATSTPALLTRAQAIASATYATLVDDQGVLREPCEPNCGGTDAPTFKGVFMRNAAVLLTANPVAENKAFVARNADWIGNAAHDVDWNIGLLWSWPIDKKDAARQASGLDALNAAVALTEARENVARTATAKVSSKCADTEDGNRAIDGQSNTKWCGGSNDAWIELDLGIAQPIGRIVVRHAGAGGEATKWNTKDFKLRVSDDGTTWTDFATVTGNTRSVTIHRTFPAIQGRLVRLEVSAAQSDPDTVATRIYEVEVYAR